MKLTTDKNTFDSDISKSKLPTLVDFFADWCTPCKMMSPLIDDIKEEFKNKINVIKINIDENPEIAEEYSVMSVPTIILFRNGKPTTTSVGVVPKEKIIELIKSSL